MFKKNIRPFLRRYFLFLIPLILLIFYSFYPIPVATIKGISQALSEKKEIEKVVVEYENQKILYGDASPEDVKKQWEEQCIEKCLAEELHISESSFSPEEKCQLRCYSRLISGEGEVYFKISEERMVELKDSSYSRLFFKNFSKNITSIYQNLIKNFNFQNIIIILLVLILYYGVVFGVFIIKRLKKQT